MSGLGHAQASTGRPWRLSADRDERLRARAVGASDSTRPEDGDWRFSVYPVLAWIPYNVSIDVNLPPSTAAVVAGAESTINSHFDGAFLAGFSATDGVWRVDTDGLWAAVGGDRVPEVPNLSVDVDVIYWHGSVGRRIAPDFFVTGGVRRIALKST